MDRWQFIQSPAGGWYWLCSDVISRRTKTSAATFKTRTECEADAMSSGYQRLGISDGNAVGKPVAPRRRRNKGR